MSNEGNPPLWLKSLQGEFPLLSIQEWEFIAEIRSRIASEIKSERQLSIDEGENIKEKLSFMKDNLKTAVKHLKSKKERINYFMDNYPKWRIFRDINIQQLKNIANSIEEERKKFQTANLIGSCISLIGGGISLAAGFRSNPLNLIKGYALSGLGSLTSAGSSVIQVGMLHGKIMEAKIVLQEDKECSEHLWAWLSDSSYLQEAMDNIRDIDVEMNLKFAANMFQDAFKRKRDKTVIDSIIKKVVISLDISAKISDEISDVIGILMATSMLYDRYRSYFHLAYTGYKLKLQLLAAKDLFRAAVSVYESVSRNGRRGVTENKNGKVMAGMVLDVVNIILVSKDLESKSEQAELIIKSADTLKREAEEFGKLYTEVCNLDV